MSSDLQQQFVHEMLTESFEGLDRYDLAILDLERGQAAAETLNNIFRVVHTIKGTAGCLGFHRIEKLAHAGENLLDLLRSGKLQTQPEITAALLKLSDSLRAMLQAIDQRGSDDSGEDSQALIARLHQLREAPTPPKHGEEGVAATKDLNHGEGGVAAIPSNQAAWGLFEAEPPPSAPPAAEAWGLFESEPSASPPPAPPPPPVATAPAKVSPSPPPPAPAAPVAAAGNTVRVDVALLDKLMNLVGELVLSRNQLIQLTQTRLVGVEELNAVSQRLNLVTTELQEGVMKTRMQPIGNIWTKFPRIVHDIARELGKEVRLQTIGAETELDRTILEAIRDPLTHIIRNSIDHGIESPEQRSAAGKSREGQLSMHAYHEGGQVNIEILDDGAGINLSRVRAKAVERGLMTADEAARLSDREATQIIFLPGFSTAEKVSNVSGRGVGMDVVKTNIEKIGGSVDVQSTAGQGTSLKIKIPLTLAIVPALVVRSHGQRFAIPQVCLLELVRQECPADGPLCEEVYGAPVFRLRGQLIPLVFLDRALQLGGENAARPTELNIVVLQADQRTFGLVVDAVLDTQEIVVKPLGKHLKGLPMFAGATIMGDGRIALILDAFGLAQGAHVLEENRDRTRAAAHQEMSAANEGGRRQLLLFKLPGRERLALPLEDTARLEEVAAKTIERSGTRLALQYRGHILPLLQLADYLPGATGLPLAGDLQIIVYQHGPQTVGFIVGEILDIVEEVVALEPGTAERGQSGSAVVQGQITDFVEIGGILRAAGYSIPKAS